MDKPVYPCLWFDGQARAAAEFYCSAFEGSGIESDNSIVVTFRLNGLTFMGLNGGPIFKINPSVSMFVDCETVSETTRIWNYLLEGGKVMMPLDKYPWSECYGWLEDKFGLTWQISVSGSEIPGKIIRPSLLFTGKQFGRAKEAIDFYCSVFTPSTAEMLAYFPEEDENAGKLMYSEFTLNTTRLIAMDGPGQHDFTFNEGISLVVSCETQEEIDHYWTRLTDGGEESRCGWLRDRFGVSWQIVPSILGGLMSDPEKGGRVMQEIMKMRKLDIASLQKA